MPPANISANPDLRSSESLAHVPDSDAILESLPGPAWIVDGESFAVLRRNAAAAVFTPRPAFLDVFSSGLDCGLIERLRSTQPKINFHSILAGEFSPSSFSANLVPNVQPRQRLIVAQPVAVFDVPTQLTFDELLDSAFDALAILDAERRFVMVSHQFQQLFGYTIDEVRGKTPAILVPPGLEHEFLLGNQTLDRGGVHHLETRRMRRDGTLVEVLVNSQPIASGRYRGGLVVVYRDLAEANRNTRYRNLRMEATRTLATATSVAQAAQELLPAIASTLGWDVVRLWSVQPDGLKCVYGHTSSGLFCSNSIQKAGVRCTIRAAQVAREGRAVWKENFQAVDECGGRVDCRLKQGSLAAFPITDTHQQVLGVLELLAPQRLMPEPGHRELLESICAHLAEFITRCKAESALAENEAKFRTLAEMAPTAIFIHVNGVAVYANAAFEAITGFARSELITRPIWTFFHPDDCEALKERVNRRLRGEDVQARCECRMLCKDGTVRWIDYSAARITLENKPAVLCAAVDVTERRALEMQLRQTQKMEAIGRLAGGIAHDFNNMLMVIGCSSELVLFDEGLSPEVRRSVEEISNASERAAALTRQLLTFSRHQVLEPRTLDLNATLAGTELILRRALGDDILLRFEFEEELGLILADPSQIEQVAMNLAVNARDAMPNGGELHISTCKVSLDASVAQAGDYAVLTVKDNGIGMTQEIQQHIFEPFFTTKSVNKGTGLGLSTVYGIAKQSGGFVTVDSQPNLGTTFKVYFPIAAGLAMTPKIAEPHEHSQISSGVILLVEDQEDVRDVLNTSLTREGFAVLQASNGPQALELSAAYEGSINLLLTDIVMSGMSGREVADELLRSRPGLKVLYVSGYNEDTVIQKGVLKGEADFLAKPFSPAVLTRKVRQVLSK